jgi:DNA-binding GntR family transcriptional regulator
LTALPGRLDAASFRGVLDLVLDELRERIVSGEISPGQVLRQRDLAEEMGVSREPIKQAMRVLEAEGLIVSPPRRSAFVAPITRKVIQDIYEVRSALDTVVARRAAQLDENARRDLCDQLDAMSRAALGRPRPKARRLVELDAAST